MTKNGSTRQAGKSDIKKVLQRHLGQRTVLGVGIPVLAAHIEATKAGSQSNGLTEKEIEKGFNHIMGKFIKSDYHSTYLHRRLGPRGFLERHDDRFRIRSSLLVGVALDDLQSLYEELVASLRAAYEQRQAAMARLEETCSLPEDRITERRDLIESYLSELGGNRGEMFEVVSFAVLREYFRSFGFSLKRFSTIHANDGGMDFVAGEAIYQVTTDESSQKVQKDLKKAPGAKKVLVRPSVTKDLLELCDDDVLEVIDLKDLLGHFIAWLLSKDSLSNRSRRLQRVLLVALEEFRREERAESA